jgi:hypothetical protein
LSLSHHEDRIPVEVIDQGEGAAVKLTRRGAIKGGHGPATVEQLAPRWDAHEGTTHFWAELPLSRD